MKEIFKAIDTAFKYAGDLDELPRYLEVAALQSHFVYIRACDKRFFITPSEMLAEVLKYIDEKMNRFSKGLIRRYEFLDDLMYEEIYIKRTEMGAYLIKNREEEVLFKFHIVKAGDEPLGIITEDKIFIEINTLAAISGRLYELIFDITDVLSF